MSESRQVKILAFNGLKRIIMWSACVDSTNYMQPTTAVKAGKRRQYRIRDRSRYGFFRRIRVRSGLVKTPVVPTAQSVPPGVAVIPCRRLLEFWAFGLGTKFQFEPFQFSVKVNWALP